MNLTRTITNTVILFIVTLLFINHTAIAQNSQCHIDDWNALKQLYINTSGTSWNNNNNWNTVTTATPQTFCDLEQLYGVKLSANGRVMEIDLNDNNLSGTIPAAIGNLIEVTNINLSLNQLSGTIPDEFSNLSTLQILDLSRNNLIGSIPNSFAALSTANGGNLVELIFEFNNLNGCYPSDLSALCAQAYYGGFISSGNNFDASWDDFCTTNAGECSCSNNLNFLSTATHSVNNVFQAGNQITSSATVITNVNVAYKANNRIRLNNGFNANPTTTTSRFSASNDGCN